MIASTNCPSGLVLQAFHEGSLSDAELDRVAAHLALCPACDAAISQLESGHPADPLQAGFRALRSQMLADTPRDSRCEPAGPPARCGRYELRDRLGIGGMGMVYRAWDPDLKRFAAVKLLRAGETARSDELNRFQREAELLARLRHVNLVEVYDVGRRQGQPYLAMELVTGGSLADLLDAGPLAPRQAAEITRSVARAAQAAHLCGITHRDIKPANILMQRPPTADADREPVTVEPKSPTTRELTPKLSDFGLARLDDAGARLTQTGLAAGTPAYMAPEQADPRLAATGPPADVWALGAVLYECLTGKPPFAGESGADVLRKVLDNPVPMPGNAPRDLAVICLKCLRKNPSDRYSNAGELADDLDRYLAGEPVRARPVGAIETACKWAKRRPAVAGLIALSLLVSALGFVLVAWKWQQAISARDALDFERGQAVSARDEAERQRREADEHYRLVRQALDRYFTRVSTNRQLQGNQSLRGRLMEDAVPMYESLAATRPSDPALAADRARAIGRLGDILRETGKSDLALARYREAIAIQEQLVAARPDDAERIVDLAGTLMSLGLLEMMTKGKGAAAQSFDRARDLVTPVVQSNPERSDCREIMAAALHGQGRAHAQAGRLDEAIQAIEQAIAEWERLKVKNPRSPEIQNQLINSLTVLAGVHRRRKGPDSLRMAAALNERAVDLTLEIVGESPNDPDFADRLAALKAITDQLERALPQTPAKAAERCEKERKMYERLVQQAPEIASYQEELIRIYDRLTWYALARGVPTEALDWLKKTAAATDRLSTQFPECTVVRDMRSLLPRSEADVMAALGRHVEAVRAWDKHLSRLPASDYRDEVRLRRAISVAALGEIDTATAEVGAVTRPVWTNGLKCFLGARALAVAAIAAGKSNPDQARRLTDDAVALILRAKEANYFQNSSAIRELAANPNLESIRSRPEIKAILDGRKQK